MTGPSRRSRAEGGRPHKVTVSFSELELAKVTAAAARADVAPGAWLGEAAVRAADAGVPGPVAGWGPVMQELMVLRGELADARRILRIAGGNLNDVARHANSTGELHQATAVVQARVARAVEQVEQTVAEVDRRLGEVRAELTGRAR